MLSSLGRVCLVKYTGFNVLIQSSIVHRNFASSIDAVVSPSSARDEILLNNLRDNPGALKKGKRVGRGPGSGKGKTAGRGTKGQKARNSPGPGVGFEGGQTPLYKRVRKYGFSNAAFRKQYAELSVDKLEEWLRRGLLNPEQPITMRDLVASGAVKANKVKAGVKLLGSKSGSSNFQFDRPVTVEVSAVTKGAQKALSQQGSQCICVYYNTLGLRALLRQHSFLSRPLMPRFARVPLSLAEPVDNSEAAASQNSLDSSTSNRRKQANTLVHPCDAPSADRFGLSKTNARPYHPLEKIY